MPPVIEGQLNSVERQILTDSVLQAPEKPEVIVEVGTWLGGGSTLTFLRALHQNGTGHLWGVEADRSVHDRMIANLTSLEPEMVGRFTPLFGLSQEILPVWIAEQKKPFVIDVAFLDGGNNPAEQISEFKILDPHLPVGARLFSHDAKLRKGKWLVPFLSHLDNWTVQLHDVSENGMMSAVKIALQPSPESSQKAKAVLTKLRWEPMEIVARVAPAGFKRFIFSKMSPKLAGRIADGKK
jgi:hypothetical protein